MGKILCSPQWFIHGGNFKKRQFFHRWDQKSGFSLSTLRNRFQDLLLLKFHHALNISIILLFAALVHFHSVSRLGSRNFCSSQWYIHDGYFEKKQFFHRCEEKSGVNLSTLRNSFQHLILLKFHHALNIFIKLVFAALVQFYSVLVEESEIICSSQCVIHGVVLKKAIFSQMSQKK